MNLCKINREKLEQLIFSDSIREYEVVTALKYVLHCLEDEPKKEEFHHHFVDDKCTRCGESFSFYYLPCVVKKCTCEMSGSSIFIDNINCPQHKVTRETNPTVEKLRIQLDASRKDCKSLNESYKNLMVAHDIMTKDYNNFIDCNRLLEKQNSDLKKQLKIAKDALFAVSIHKYDSDDYPKMVSENASAKINEVEK